jgi:anti-sigma-K factor RskA
MSNDTHVLELLPAYALDCLDEDETILVSEHLAVCSVCQAELRAYQDVADQLGLTAPTAAPPPTLKTRLMERIHASLPAVSPQSQPSWWQSLANLVRRTTPVWGTASFLLILVLLVSNLLLWQQVNRPTAMIGPAGMRAIPLSSTGVAPGASGFIIIGADGQNGAVVVDKLPQLDPEERQYQLWLIRDGQRTSGALLSVDQAGYGGTRITAPESLFEYSTVGITIEPAGGSPGPTGDRVLAGIIN